MVKPERWSDRMERAAFAPVIAVTAPQDFGAQPFGVGSAGKQMAMIAVCRKQIVVCPKAGQRRYAGRFLANVKMIMAGEDTFVVKRDKALVEMADDEHSAAEVDERLS
jgi:hypothetical protein